MTGILLVAPPPADRELIPGIPVDVLRPAGGEPQHPDQAVFFLADITVRLWITRREDEGSTVWVADDGWVPAAELGPRTLSVPAPDRDIATVNKARERWRPAQSLPACHDCGVRPGQAHVPGCDVARCLFTGLQQLSCPGHFLEYARFPLDDGWTGFAPADCGHDVWTGRWPGEAECEEYGLMIAPGIPDLNRLILECDWDPGQRRWVRRAAAGEGIRAHGELGGLEP
jgi:hypothetical protein